MAELSRGVLQLSAPDFLEFFRTARKRCRKIPKPQTSTFIFNTVIKRSISNKKYFIGYNFKPIIIPCGTFKSIVVSKVKNFRILRYFQPDLFTYWQFWVFLHFYSILDAVYKVEDAVGQ